MATLTLGIEELFLDVLNPRHEPVKTQAEALRAIIDEQGTKLVALMKDIAERGLNPMDRILVFKSGKKYVVLEGNRRIASLKLLRNPSLAEGTPLARDVRRVATGVKVQRAVECGVVGSRAEAKEWLKLRHNGEQEGRGVVPWNALASARFGAAPGSREARWVELIDTIQSTYPNNQAIQDALATVAGTRMTTLGRLYADPDFRDHLGLQDGTGPVTSTYPAAELEATIQRVLTDLAGDLSVTKIKSKQQRSDYLATLPKPRKGSALAAPAPLSGTTHGTAGRAPAPRRRASRLASPFRDLNMRALHVRVDDIVQELRKLDVEKFPNAAAILTRVVLELSLDAFIATKSLNPRDTKLRAKLTACLGFVDPTGKDPKYQGIRTGLGDKTSIYAVATLHGYVHNKDFHPTPANVRGIVENLKPFLQAMNDLA